MSSVHLVNMYRRSTVGRDAVEPQVHSAIYRAGKEYGRLSKTDTKQYRGKFDYLRKKVGHLIGASESTDWKSALKRAKKKVLKRAEASAAKNAELKAKKKTRLAVLAEELGLLEEHRGWRQC
jgi:hypothetical protein